MFVSTHLLTCRHFWQCLCPPISWPADTFHSVCVHPSHDLQTLFTVFVSTHLLTCRQFWQCLCPPISWPADNFDSVCVHPSYDLQTHLTVFESTFDSVCVHFWLCLCPPISWPADTFDSVCVHPSHDLQTLWQHGDLQTHLTVFVSIHLMTCRHIWQHDHLQTHLTVFVSILLITCRHFWLWALLSLDNAALPFFIDYNCFQGTIWYWCHSVVFQAAWQCHALHVWYRNLPMQERAAEHLWTTKSPRKLQTEEQEINWLSVWLSWGDPVWLTGH